MADSVKEIKVDNRPKKGVLLSYRRRSFGWLKALCELADNSCDADAKHISLEMKPGEIIFTDDGRGMSREAMESLFTLGGHLEYDSTKTGEFGIGFKDCACWLWGDNEITCISKGTNRSIHVNLESWLQKEEWTTVVKEHPCDPTLPKRTSIRIRKFDRKAPTEKQWEDLISRLGFLYGPTIDSGVQFAARWMGEPSVALHPYSPMTLGSAIKETISIPSGKTAKIYAIQLDTRFQQRHSGVQYFRSPRIVLEDSPLGTGDYSRSGVYVMVELSRGWKLGTNKDSIDDPDEDTLIDEVYRVIQPLLEKSKTSELAVRENDLTLKIADLMNYAYKRQRKSNPVGPPSGIKPKRPSKPGPLVDDPAGKENSEEQEESLMRGFQIKFETLTAADGLGRKCGKSVIELAKNNPFIEQWYRVSNTDEAARILALVAFWIFESDPEQIRNIAQQELELTQNEEQQLIRSAHMPARVCVRLNRIYSDPATLLRLVKNQPTT